MPENAFPSVRRPRSWKCSRECRSWGYKPGAAVVVWGAADGCQWLLRSWVLAKELRQRYTTGARGHYLSDERPEETVARYRRRGSEQEIEIRHVFSWFGTECSATEAHCCR
ncbi:hypothetical protein KDK_57420 [Dictyobacter kobayashii]|uniref:Uncharacterized protein n=2 Tax=Dictyobacter kobayashii TaxID=2014872 RepID=A0A402AS76_9CHLR|nr:hypothetical protein KDK_57420 [Dictyobacter kobayashii]